MKRILSLLLCAAALCGCLQTAPAAAANEDTILRVGLTVSGSSSFADPKLENVTGYASGYTAGVMNGTAFSGSKTITATQLTIRLVDDAFQISDTASGKVLYTTAKGADHLAIQPKSTLTWFKGYRWQGSFVYRRAGNGNLTVINYVGLEDYVKGVLPYEIDPDWPAEAQKAQAVCARSFALGTHKHTASGYDLCNTTNCQVYLGANKATAASNAAVNDTRGQYLTYQGKPVIGYFFSSDGGATEDAVNVWGGDYPYLKGKVDPYEGKVDEWSVTLTAEEVRKKLISAGYTIGTVAKVEVTKRTATDNVNEVTVTDTDGKTVTIQRDKVRTVFGLKSIRYTITPHQTKAVKTLPVSAALQKIVPSVHQITLDGKKVTPQGWNIGGENYYKLRDIAYIMNGTGSQFNVGWDNAKNCISLFAGQAYQPVGDEMSSSASSAVKTYMPATASIVLDGKDIQLTGYHVNGNNYYRVRDMGKVLNFTVDFDPESEMVLLCSADQSGQPVQPEQPEQSDTPAASYTFTGSGWGHSVGMSQWGAYAMAKQGFTYEDILKFYFTGISLAG